MLSSTKPDSLRSVGVDGYAVHRASATDRQLSIAPASCPSLVQLEADAAGAHLLDQRLGPAALPFAEETEVDGSSSAAWSMRARFQGPGVQVVALCPPPDGPARPWW